MSTEYTWRPPLYNVSRPPDPISTISLPSDDKCMGDFVRSAKWFEIDAYMSRTSHLCSTGVQTAPQLLRSPRIEHFIFWTCTLSNSFVIRSQTQNSQPCRPPELMSTSISHIPRSANISFTRPFPQPSPILDFVWYPQATVQDPASFCFVASVRDTPVRLVDAGDGRVRTYLTQCRVRS
jgi:telomerase Cajal body protein 1